jgi:DNA-binding transcriptional LysR family regulator
MQELHDGALDLNLLMALDALLLERNVTRAAARVGLTQSAMSHKLRRLRELFDDDLLVGGRQGMVPTERALALAGPVRRGLLELHSAIRITAPFDSATARRDFTIVSSDYADCVILPRVLEHLSRHAPGIGLRMRPPMGALQQALEDGSADIVMGRPVEGSGLKQRLVFEETFVVIVRAGHPALADDGASLPIERYVELGHVMVSANDEPGIVDLELAKRGLSRLGRRGRHAGPLADPADAGAALVVPHHDDLARASATRSRPRVAARAVAPPHRRGGGPAPRPRALRLGVRADRPPSADRQRRRDPAGTSALPSISSSAGWVASRGCPRRPTPASRAPPPTHAVPSSARASAGHPPRSALPCRCT